MDSATINTSELNELHRLGPGARTRLPYGYLGAGTGPVLMMVTRRARRVWVLITGAIALGLAIGIYVGTTR